MNRQPASHSPIRNEMELDSDLVRMQNLGGMETSMQAGTGNMMMQNFPNAMQAPGYPGVMPQGLQYQDTSNFIPQYGQDTLMHEGNINQPIPQQVLHHRRSRGSVAQGRQMAEARMALQNPNVMQ